MNRYLYKSVINRNLDALETPLVRLFPFNISAGTQPPSAANAGSSGVAGVKYSNFIRNGRRLAAEAAAIAAEGGCVPGDDLNDII